MGSLQETLQEARYQESLDSFEAWSSPKPKLILLNFQMDFLQLNKGPNTSRGQTNSPLCPRPMHSALDTFDPWADAESGAFGHQRGLREHLRRWPKQEQIGYLVGAKLFSLIKTPFGKHYPSWQRYFNGKPLNYQLIICYLIYYVYILYVINCN